MTDRLELDVRWPSGRLVRVAVSTEPLVGPPDEAPDDAEVTEEIQKRIKPSREIDGGVLESRASLDSFLADVTRTDDGPVSAWCLKGERWETLFELLELEGADPGLVEVALPAASRPLDAGDISLDDDG